MEKTKSLTSKVLIVVLVIITVSGGAMGAVGYLLNRNTVVERSGREALSLAQGIAAAVDTGKFERTVALREEDGYQQEVKRYLDKVKTDTGALWTYVAFMDGGGNMKLFADGDDLTGVMPPGEAFLTEINLDEYYDGDINRAVLSGEPVQSGIINGEDYGATIDGIAPLKDGSGKLIGIVCVELSASGVLASLNVFILYMIGSMVIFGSVFLLISAKVGNVILKVPCAQLTEASNKLANGDMNVQLNIKSKTEFGRLASDFTLLGGNINTLISAMKVMTEAHAAGDTDARIDASSFNGAYKEVALGINETVGSYAAEINDICRVLDEFGEGNSHAEYVRLPGKKAAANDAVENLRNNFAYLAGEINGLAEAAISGNLNARADTGKYKGDWAGLLDELNRLVKSIADKAIWYESLLDGVPSPIFATDTDMNWTFLNTACERMVGRKRSEAVGMQCHNFGTVICKSNNCAINNYKKGIFPTKFSEDGKHYQVSVADIKDGTGRTVGYVEVIADTTETNEMLLSLNQLVTDIKAVSEHVTGGAKQIAESSQHLAGGAVSQASAVEELNASIDIINDKTQTNAKNSATANELSMKAKENALLSNEQMKQMVSAIESIKEKSHNISKINKTIEDIAFQTNLLALNAAVEAARAGDHGKGFAVVADEVRTLASRSQAAAKETNELISQSIASVDNGAAIAVSTAQSLAAIVTDFDNVSEVIRKIDAASSEQSESIRLISAGVSQISDVTQQNSAASQETAAASQQLASQAETLRNMVHDF